MYTPKLLKERFGKHFEYRPEERLIPKYDLLVKYNLLNKLDEMIFEDRYEITGFLQLFKTVTEKDLIEEFFEGCTMGELDMLNGDLSELSPVIHDRIKLYRTFNNCTVGEVMDKFISNSKTKDSLYRDYFEQEVTS